MIGAGLSAGRIMVGLTLAMRDRVRVLAHVQGNTEAAVIRQALAIGLDLLETQQRAIARRADTGLLVTRGDGLGRGGRAV